MNGQQGSDGTPEGHQAVAPAPTHPAPAPGRDAPADQRPEPPAPARPRPATPPTTAAPAPWERPALTVVWRAIDLYLAAAYPAGADGVPAVPSAVKTRLQALRPLSEADFWQASAFERDATDPQAATRYALRLGNRTYPHMKLIVHRAPSGGGYLLRADTHDAHCRPDPSSKEYGMFCSLMDQNRTIAESIEAAWEAADLPTFKKFLREDLARRQRRG